MPCIQQMTLSRHISKKPTVLDGKCKREKHATSYPLQWFLYKMVSDFLPANSQSRLGMDKALTEEYPNENTLEQIGKREQGKLFLSDVWGRKCQLLESVPYFHDKLGDAFYT